MNSMILVVEPEVVLINPGLLLSFSEPIAVNLETTLPGHLVIR